MFDQQTQKVYSFHPGFSHDVDPTHRKAILKCLVNVIEVNQIRTSDPSSWFLFSAATTSSIKRSLHLSKPHRQQVTWEAPLTHVASAWVRCADLHQSRKKYRRKRLMKSELNLVLTGRRKIRSKYKHAPSFHEVLGNASLEVWIWVEELTRDFQVEPPNIRSTASCSLRVNLKQEIYKIFLAT